MDQSLIRNFCIIAHIDHGKSTLADRFLELTGTVEKRRMHEQYLDTMELEQERGITIKLQPVRMEYEIPNVKFQMTNKFQISNSKSPVLNLKSYILNLIDTPGHVDFTYEVSRALAACEGAVLLVDATQGIQAQTLANLHLAQAQGLKIIPVMNKLDLPNAEPERVAGEIVTLLGFEKKEILSISAKTGEGVEELLRAIVERVPPPQGKTESPARALVFDSTYDKHRGVVAFVRVVDGKIGSREAVTFMSAKQQTHILELGYFRPQFLKADQLVAGEVGYIVTDFREVAKAKVGDTITTLKAAEQTRKGAEGLLYEDLTFKIRGAMFAVKKQLGLGHKEIVYQNALEIEFNKHGLLFEREPYINVKYDDQKVGTYVPDFVVGGKVVIELKSLPFVGSQEEKQVWSYLKGTKYRLALLANFGATELSIIRIIFDIARSIQPGSALSRQSSALEPLPGYREVKPMVYASFFPETGGDYPKLRDAIGKLKLSDAALSYEPVTVPAIGTGFRCGFLGLLHLDIVQERLFREYNLDLVVTAPTVEYRVKLRSGEDLEVHSAAELPDPSHIEEMFEPWVNVEVITPAKFLGGVLEILTARRGVQKNVEYASETRVLVSFEIPLANIIVDFYDKLKSTSSGYASMNYEFLEFRSSELVKLEIMVSGERVEAFSNIVFAQDADRIGREILLRLKDLIPRHQFAIALQAAIGGKIVARETISPFRKDVTAGLYGGDDSRKRKVLEKQKKGKKRLKQFGRVSIPQETFIEVFKR